MRRGEGERAAVTLHSLKLMVAKTEGESDQAKHDDVGCGRSLRFGKRIGPKSSDKPGSVMSSTDSSRMVHSDRGSGQAVAFGLETSPAIDAM